MSRLYPHSPYAEDQPYAHTILTVHVLHRGLQTGAVLGLCTGLTRSLLLRLPLASTLLTPTGYGALIGTALMIPGLPVYMAGKTEVEWQDRSWRLLENAGQKEVDDWSSVGFVGGAVVAARSEAFRLATGRRRWVRLAGGAAAGNLLGVVGYLGWRYGVHQGKGKGEV